MESGIIRYKDFPKFLTLVWLLVWQAVFAEASADVQTFSALDPWLKRGRVERGKSSAVIVIHLKSCPVSFPDWGPSKRCRVVHTEELFLRARWKKHHVF